MNATGVKIAAAATAAAIIGLTAAVIIAVHHDSRQAQTPKPATKTSEPCSTDQQPCIQLTAEDGTKYKLNDFRFLPGHCIAIISLPDNTSRKLCGNYKLDWIGPDTSHDIKEQKI